MKNKSLPAVLLCLISVIFLSGCNPIGSKTTSLSIIYLITTSLSLALLAGYLLAIKKRDAWFIVLFASVLVVNAGYYLLSVSDTLSKALWANRISYLGSVFLPLSMLMSILKLSRIEYKKWLVWLLLSISIIIFFIAASPGILNIYYKSVSLENVNGVSVLHKEYGPFHAVYLFYLLGYFAAMIVSVILAAVKKKIDSTVHALILLSAVFVNICVWLFGQLVDMPFEFLSVSYIITELFLICVYLMIQLQDFLIASLQEKLAAPHEMAVKIVTGNSPEFVEHLNFFAEQIPSLTASEKSIYNCYVAGMSTKEVLAEKNIAESTLKYHNRNLYSKLGVSSRKELLHYARALNNTLSNDQND